MRFLFRFDLAGHPKHESSSRRQHRPGNSTHGTYMVRTRHDVPIVPRGKVDVIRESPKEDARFLLALIFFSFSFFWGGVSNIRSVAIDYR